MKDSKKIELVNMILEKDLNGVETTILLQKAKDGVDIQDAYNQLLDYCEKATLNISEEGFFGNVWVRKQSFPKKGTCHEGHKHIHDHVSLLTSGSVSVKVEGHEPKVFIAPTYLTVKANMEHQITALEDGTTAWCVFAMRKKNGMLTDYYNGDNSPYGHLDVIRAKEADEANKGQ